MRSSLSLGLVLVLAVASCSKPPVLTDSLRERYALTESELRRVQLFNSDEIVLRREIAAEERSVSGAELRVRGGVQEEDVIIPARTPCVALRVDGNYVLVGFEPGDPSKSLWFALDTKSEPSAEGRRYLLAPIANPPDAPSPLQPVVAKGFLVTYGGKKHRVADARSWGAHLLVDLEESFKRNRVKQEPSGWKLDEKPNVPSLRVTVSPPAASAQTPPAPSSSDAGAPP